MDTLDIFDHDRSTWSTEERELEKKAERGRGFDAGHTRQSGQGRQERSLQIC